MKYYYKDKPVELGSRLSVKEEKGGRSIEFFTTSLDESDAEFLCNSGIFEKREEKDEEKQILTVKEILSAFAESKGCGLLDAISFLTLIPTHARIMLLLDIAARLIDRRYDDHIKKAKVSIYYYFEPLTKSIVSISKEKVAFGKKGLFRSYDDAREAVDVLSFLMNDLYE